MSLTTVRKKQLEKDFALIRAILSLKKRKMKTKEARHYILFSILFAIIIFCIIAFGPRLVSLVSTKSGLATAKQESNYTIIPATIGTVAFNVLIADTDERRIRGLSYREKLDEHLGMFFIFDYSDRHGIWMKEMKFSIDILWLNSHLKVVHVEKDVSPETYPAVFKPSADARYVLETNAGFAEKNDINVGSEMVLYR
jgi:uncharacterized protein